MIFEGTYRRFLALRSGKATIDARMTFLESMAVGQVEPPGYELARAGRRMSLGYNGTVPTGIAPVQALPTTAAQWVIWNADATKSYVMEVLGALLFSGTAGLGGQLLAAIFATPAQTGANATGLGVASGSKTTSSSAAIIKSGVTVATPALPVWVPIAEQIGAAAVVGPASIIANRNVQGRIIVPPGYGLGLAVLAPAGTTPLYLPIAEWVEVESDLE